MKSQDSTVSFYVKRLTWYIAVGKEASMYKLTSKWPCHFIMDYFNIVYDIKFVTLTHQNDDVATEPPSKVSKFDWSYS